MLDFPCNPVNLTIQAFEELYPEKSAMITLSPEMGSRKGEILGSTFFPEDKSTPIIEVSANLKFVGFIDILSHELAHVANPEDEHGEKWQESYDKINEKYNELFYKEIENKKLSGVSLEVGGE